MFPMEHPSGDSRPFIQLAGSGSAPKRLRVVGLGPAQGVSQALVEYTCQVHARLSLKPELEVRLEASNPRSSTDVTTPARERAGDGRTRERASGDGGKGGDRNGGSRRMRASRTARGEAGSCYLHPR